MSDLLLDEDCIETTTRYKRHRRVWEEAHGPIPAGMHVLHRCDNPRCYRLSHLWLGTHAENMHDMVAKGRAHSWIHTPRATACRHGHPYPENAYYDSKGWPHCRACDAQRKRARRACR